MSPVEVFSLAITQLVEMEINKFVGMVEGNVMIVCP
jgi:hypothetical protein